MSNAIDIKVDKDGTIVGAIFSHEASGLAVSYSASELVALIERDAMERLRAAAATLNATLHEGDPIPPIPPVLFDTGG